MLLRAHNLAYAVMCTMEMEHAFMLFQETLRGGRKPLVNLQPSGYRAVVAHLGVAADGVELVPTGWLVTKCVFTYEQAPMDTSQEAEGHVVHVH